MTNLRSNHLNRRHPVVAGFSLAEIPITLAVIVILALIIGTAISHVSKSARKSSSLSNLSQLGKATQLYVADNSDTYPPYYISFGDNPELSALPESPSFYWKQSLMPYIKNDDIFYSHIDPFARKSTGIDDIPYWRSREHTSYLFDIAFELALQKANYSLKTTTIDFPKEYWFMQEPYAGYISSSQSSRQAEVPVAGDSIGVLRYDGSVKRVPWVNPLEGE